MIEKSTDINLNSTLLSKFAIKKMLKKNLKK